MDKTFEDLRALQVDFKKREESNGIKPDKLMKVNRLLAALHESVESLTSDGMGESMLQVKNKMAAATVRDESYKAFEITMEQYHHELRKAGRLGPIPTVLYYAGMNDKLDLTRMPIMKKKRTRLQPGSQASIPVVVEDMQQTFLEEPRVESTSVPASQPQKENQGSSQDKGDCVAWVECVKCSKWRVLPRGVDATTLHDDWTCSNGASWRSTGLNCDVAEDVDEDVT